MKSQYGAAPEPRIGSLTLQWACGASMMRFSSPLPPPPPPAFDMSHLIVLVVIAALVCVQVLRSLVRRLRSPHAVYDRLAEEKRREVATAFQKACAAGLDWDGCLKWAAAHQTLQRKASARSVLLSSPPPLRQPSAVLLLTACELIEEMNASRLTSEYVTRCFVARAIAVDESLHCVTEADFERAVAEAKACDVERASGTLRGPLHGLPISVKEQMHMAGARLGSAPMRRPQLAAHIPTSPVPR